jgi:hypothetical protein
VGLWVRESSGETCRVFFAFAHDSRAPAFRYQLSGMANRTTIVDNNTWNATHIARVGRALLSTEESAYRQLLELGATHVMVVCGAKSGVRNDDIGKLIWPIRLGALRVVVAHSCVCVATISTIKAPTRFHFCLSCAGSAEFPADIRESHFLSRDGRLHVDADGSPPLHNSIAYKLCYHRFGEVRTRPSKPLGFDAARLVEIGHAGFRLSYFEEAYTTEHWLARIYRLKTLDEVERAGLILRPPPPQQPRGRTAADYLFKPVPYWTPDGYRPDAGVEPHSAARQTEDVLKKSLGLRFLGCYKTEAAFAGDRIYNRGAVGAHLPIARSHAGECKAQLCALNHNVRRAMTLIYLQFHLENRSWRLHAWRGMMATRTP